jgi:hypothetical protein
LWFDDDPLAGPPDNLDYIADINTGHAYTETYRRLIKNPDKQILMGVQFYMDAAVTGQFANLPVTTVWCAFTIFNRRAQEQDYFWGMLGGGTSTLADRLRMVCIEDSVGYVHGVAIVFSSFGIITAFGTLTEWCQCKDHEAMRKKANREHTDESVL